MASSLVLTIIESPFAGDTERHVRYARLCLLDSLYRGEAPLASHLLYPQCLNDDVPDERTLGIDAGWAWLPQAAQQVFYCDMGFSPGMQTALASRQNRRTGPGVRYRRLWPAVELGFDGNVAIGTLEAFKKRHLSDEEFDRLAALYWPEGRSIMKKEP